MSDLVAGPFRLVSQDRDGPALPRPNSLRRAHDSSRMAVAAAAAVLEEAGLTVSDRLGVYVGLHHIPADYSKAFIDTARKDGPRLASPVHFSESVANNVASHLSMTLKTSGIIETYIGTRSAGLNALEAAVQDLRSGAVEDALLVVLAWSHPVTGEAYRALWDPRGRAALTMDFLNAALAFRLRLGEGKGTVIEGVTTRSRGIGLQSSLGSLKELWTPGKEERVLLSCLGLERSTAVAGLGNAGLQPLRVEGEAFALDPFLQLLADQEAAPTEKSRVVLVAGEDGIAGVLRTRTVTGVEEG